jgi:hypothetical protein
MAADVDIWPNLKLVGFRQRWPAEKVASGRATFCPAIAYLGSWGLGTAGPAIWSLAQVPKIKAGFLEEPAR